MELKKDERELVEDYRRMSPDNKAHLLSLAHATRASQETTLKSMGKKKTSRAKVTA
jgi:hypothetical protein